MIGCWDKGEEGLEDTKILAEVCFPFPLILSLFLSKHTGLYTCFQTWLLARVQALSKKSKLL